MKDKTDNLFMTLQGRWFDMILADIKKEEYREIKGHWINRLNREYKTVTFQNGYSKTSRRLTIACLGIEQGIGNKDWGAPAFPVFKIKLGQIISTENI